jgi:hypothetical protein
MVRPFQAKREFVPHSCFQGLNFSIAPGTEGPQRDGSVLGGYGVIRIQLKDMVEVADRPLVIPLLGVCDPTVGVGLGVLRIKPDGRSSSRILPIGIWRNTECRLPAMV